MRRLAAFVLVIMLSPRSPAHAQRYTAADGKLRVTLAQQPFSPNGTVPGPRTMAQGGIQRILADLGASVRVQEAALTADEETADRRRSAPRDAGRVRALDRLSRVTDKLYVHIDMDVLDPREVMAHQNKVPNGPSSEELARLFEMIFSRYPTASAIGFATIPATDEGGLSLAAVNRMIAGAVRGVKARETSRK
jgi:hypothetical protein